MLRRYRPLERIDAAAAIKTPFIQCIAEIDSRYLHSTWNWLRSYRRYEQRDCAYRQPHFLLGRALDVQIVANVIPDPRKTVEEGGAGLERTRGCGSELHDLI